MSSAHRLWLTWVLAVALAYGLTACVRGFQKPAPTPQPTPTITVPPLPTRAPSPTPADNAAVGPFLQHLAPDFTLPALFADRTYRLSQWRGTPVVLNFWATWCPPCIEELPMLAEYARRYEGRILFVALNVDESPVKVQRFVREQGLADSPLLFLRDPTSTVSLTYRVNGFPTTFFIDAQGIIRYIRVGGMYEEDLQRGLQALQESGP